MPSAIAPDETSTTSRPIALERRDLRRPARERRMVEPAPVVGDEARADLDDEPRGGGDRSAHGMRVPRDQVPVAGAASASSPAALRRAAHGVRRMRVEPVLDRERQLAAAARR